MLQARKRLEPSLPNLHLRLKTLRIRLLPIRFLLLRFLPIRLLPIRHPPRQRSRPLQRSNLLLPLPS